MARRIPRDESLATVRGVGSLFAAGYGNVDSSIHYTLGVVAERLCRVIVVGGPGEARAAAPVVA